MQENKATTTRKKTTKSPNKKQVSSVKKLKILITIVNRSKAIYYEDLLEQFDVNVQMILYGKGTANSQLIDLLGLVESDKAVIISCIKEDKVKDALETLNEKFNKVKHGKGIAFTVPLDSIIGVSSYQLLSNDRTVKEGEMK
ncbi:MAG: hypothetical protein J6V68_04150 [Clostridia bacterium]|nr:hypothetical protein [Clostridia bacterium]